jgi:hypothetical protein
MNKAICLFLALVSGISFGGGTVPDTTQASAKLGDILTDPKNVDKLDTIIMGVGYGVSVGTWAAKNREGLKDAAKETIKDIGDDFKKIGTDISGSYKEAFENGEIAVPYKNSKGSFFVFMRTTQKVLLDILNTASDRIDMWRTTLPTLQAWGKSTRRLIDNTKEVYTSFKWKDLWDIDRKWSRKMENVNMKWINDSYRFMDYLWGLGDVSVGNRFKDRYEKYIDIYELDSTIEENSDLKVLKDVIDWEEKISMEDTTKQEGRAYLFHFLPITQQETALSALMGVMDVMEGSVVGKDDMFEVLQNELVNPQITYLGSMALLANIKQHRTDVEAQRTILRQIQSNMATMYARVQMMEMEEEAVSLGKSVEELKLLMGKTDWYPY